MDKTVSVGEDSLCIMTLAYSLRHRRDLPRRLIVFGHRACNGRRTDGRTDTCFVCAAAVLFRPRVNNIKDLSE